jgi:hypothetical protein
MGPLTRGAALDLEEDLDQLQLTGQFLEDLATRVASDEGRRCCLDAAQGFRLAASKRKHSRAPIGEDTIAA